MRPLREIIHEIHRRSLWQVLGIYLFGGWVALQVVQAISHSAGLPDWVPSFALVLLILGLPMCLATAFVQEGMGRREAPPETPVVSDPGPKPVRLGNRLFTWRNAFFGAGAASILLVLALAGYFAMRTFGFGPAASLVAQGIFEEEERVVLADFEDTSPEESLSGLITEALRVDLLESSALTVVDPSFIQEVLIRMQVDPGSPLTPSLAREVAQREGIKAVIQGDIGPVGSGYLLTARLSEAESGQILAAFRETAADESEIIRAIDRLSAKIREKSGESLRSIRAGERLADVTTTSLDALRLYSEGSAAVDRGDDAGGAIRLEQALQFDSTFAMAWRKLGVVLLRTPGEAERGREAVTRAWEFRDRLTERERLLAEAYYHSVIEADMERSTRAYRRVLDLAPNDKTALNNLGIRHLAEGELDSAEALLRRAVENPAGASGIHYRNLAQVLMAANRTGEAREVLAEGSARVPSDGELTTMYAAFLAGVGESLRADSVIRAAEAFASSSADRQRLVEARALMAFQTGRIARGLEMGEGLAAGALRQGNAEQAFGAVAVGALVRLEVLGDRTASTAMVDDFFRAHPLDSLQVSVDVLYPLAHFTGLLADPGRSERVERAIRARVAEESRRLGSAPPLFDEMLEVTVLRIRLGSLAPADSVARLYGDLEVAVACGVCFNYEGALVREALGDREEALALLEVVAGSPGQFPWRQGLALEDLARLREAAGDREGAAEAYRALVALWAEADETLQPRVAAARERLEATEGG